MDAPERVKLGSYEPASPVCRQERHFYLRFLSLLSKRKLSNATSRLHDVTTKVSIPKNIEIISNAVIGATSLPRQRLYITIESLLARETTTLSWVLFTLFSALILYHLRAFNSIKHEHMFAEFVIYIL